MNDETMNDLENRGPYFFKERERLDKILHEHVGSWSQTSKLIPREQNRALLAEIENVVISSIVDLTGNDFEKIREEADLFIGQLNMRVHLHENFNEIIDAVKKM